MRQGPVGQLFLESLFVQLQYGGGDRASFDNEVQRPQVVDAGRRSVSRAEANNHPRPRWPVRGKIPTVAVTNAMYDSWASVGNQRAE